MQRAPDENQSASESKNARAKENVEAEKYKSLLNILRNQEEFLLDKNGFIIASNLEAVNITGYEEYEVIGKHISILYSPDEQKRCELDLRKADNFGTIHVSGMRRRKRGSDFWAKMKITRVESEVAGYKISLKDATYRALYNIQVRTLRDEYLTIFNNPFVGTFKFRMRDFQITMHNDKAREISGNRELGSENFASLFKIEQQFWQFITLLRCERKVDGFEFLLNDNGDMDNWALLSARYFQVNDFVEGVLIDISEKYRQLTELQRVNSELDQFIYHASHDLRSPLVSILGLANLGGKETSITEAHTYFKMIEDRIIHLDSLLKDLMIISDNNTSAITANVIDFDSEINEILKSIMLYHEQPPNVQFEVHHEHEFVNDLFRTRTILRKLIANSVEQCLLKNTPSFIKIYVRVNRACVEIQVEDNGVGIDEFFHAKMYDKFFRADSRSKGTGLSLHIVKAIVDRLGGQITFESAPTEGTTFYLNIPNHAEPKASNLFLMK